MTQVKRKTKTILVVEDDADIGSVLLEIFALETSYRAVLATDGLLALDIVKDLTPDLFILNYWLPHMNGLELYDRLHALPELRHVPTLLLSANPPTREIAGRKMAVIEKPLDIDKLLKVIADLLAGS